QRVRSGLSIISTTSGSSSAAAISGPIAVRSIWMRRSNEVDKEDCGAALMRLAPAAQTESPYRPCAPARDAAPPPHHAPGCGHAKGGGQAVRRTVRNAPCPGRGRHPDGLREPAY